jgi:hypothetical protein
MSRIRKKEVSRGIGVIPIRIFSNAIRLSADTIRKPADGIRKMMTKTEKISIGNSLFQDFLPQKQQLAASDGEEKQGNGEEESFFNISLRNCHCQE